MDKTVVRFFSRNLLSNLMQQGNEITFLYIDSSQGQSLGEGD